MKPVHGVTALFLVLLGGAVLSVLLAGWLMPAQRPPAVREGDRWLDLGGDRMRYRAMERAGPTYIFLHGFGGSLDAWEPLAQALTCGRSVLIDLVGFGASSRSGGGLSLSQHRDSVIQLMDALGVRTAVLVGHSMGGSIAVWTAASAPERVTALALFAPSAYPDSMRNRWPGNLVYRPGLANGLVKVLVSNALFRKVFPNSLASQAIAVTASYGAGFRQALEKVSQPVLLHWSRGDEKVSFAHAARYQEQLRACRLVELPEEVGHAAFRYRPEETARRICAWIGELRGGRG